MKLKKFYTIIKEHTWLHSHMAGVRGLYGYNRGTPKQIKAFRDWVRQNISYVAVRPWESLNLLSRNEKQTILVGDKGHGIHRITEYEVIWHAQDGTPRKASFATNTNHFQTSVGQIINWIFEHHINLPSDVTSIQIDMVIRHSYTYSTIIGDYTNESFEIFYCPPNWIPEWIQGDLTLRSRAARKGVTIQGLAV